MTKKEKEIIENSTQSLTAVFPVERQDAIVMLSKAFLGGEIANIRQSEIDSWINGRLNPNTVTINRDAYTEMCIDALKILPTTAATDFGGSRQRDLGQLWADMTRGYLGEYAFRLFAKKWNVEVQLGHELGDLKDFLPSDVKMVKDQDGNWRDPGIKIGIKTTKINGIWLDIPGDQFSHSDIHVQIKVAAGRGHLFGYLKDLSVFRDKVLTNGVKSGVISQDEANNLFEKLPDFKPIPAYICGFVRRDEAYRNLDYVGKKGTKNYRASGWRGPFDPRINLDEIKSKEDIQGDVVFEGIQHFTKAKRYLFNSGNMLWQKEEWDSVFCQL